MWGKLIVKQAYSESNAENQINPFIILLKVQSDFQNALIKYWNVQVTAATLSFVRVYYNEQNSRFCILCVILEQTDKSNSLKH